MSDAETTEPTPDEDAAEGLATATLDDVQLVVRSLDRREIEARIVPFNEVVFTRDIGAEMFLPGAFAHVDPSKVVLQLEHQEPAAGVGISIEERADGAYMVFRASRTARGEEILQLAHDKVTRGASVTYDPAHSEFEMRSHKGKRVTAVKKADLRAVSTTWKPVYERAAVIAVRSQEGVTPMSEAAAVETPVTPEVPPPAAPTAVVAEMHDNTDLIKAIKDLVSHIAQNRSSDEGMAERIQQLEERARAEFTMPSGGAKPDWANKGHLFDRAVEGDAVPFRMRTIDDVKVADQDAMLPAYVAEMDDVLNTARPFLETTREIPVPDEGTAIQLPKITQHTEVDVQSAEKTEVASRALKTDLDTFNMITVAGAVDVSLQFLKRAPSAIRALLFDDMAAEYAASSDSEAIDALLAAAAVHEGGTFDPENPQLGAAFINAYAVNRGRLPADTIWLSTSAVGGFIDAVDDNTQKPLYGSIQADASVPGGLTGTIRGLRARHVPALEDKGVDVVVGPSRGFIWAEDGTYRLESDNPALAGRDIGIVGFLFLMPRYPAAFTSYTLGS